MGRLSTRRQRTEGSNRFRFSWLTILSIYDPNDLLVPPSPCGSLLPQQPNILPFDQHPQYRYQCINDGHLANWYVAGATS